MGRPGPVWTSTAVTAAKGAVAAVLLLLVAWSWPAARLSWAAPADPANSAETNGDGAAAGSGIDDFLELARDPAVREILSRIFPADYRSSPVHLTVHRRALRTAELLLEDLRSVFLNLPVPEPRLKVLAELGLYDPDGEGLSPRALSLQIRARWTLSRLRALQAEDRAGFLLDELLYRTVSRGTAPQLLESIAAVWPHVDPADPDALLAAQGLVGLDGGLERRSALSDEQRRAFDQAWRRLAEAVEGELYAILRSRDVDAWWKELVRQASFAGGVDAARLACTVQAHAAYLAREALADGQAVDLDELARRIGKPGWSGGLRNVLESVAIVDGAVVLAPRSESGAGGDQVRLDPSRRQNPPDFDSVLEAHQENRLTVEHLACLDPMLVVASRAFAAGKGDVASADQANRYAYFEAHPAPLPYDAFREGYFADMVDVHARSLASYLAGRADRLGPAVAELLAGRTVEGLSQRDEELARTLAMASPARLATAGHEALDAYRQWLAAQVEAIHLQRGAVQAREALKADGVVRVYFDRNITNNLYRELLTVEDVSGERRVLYAVKAVLDHLRGRTPPYPAVVGGGDIVDALVGAFRDAGVELPEDAVTVPDLRTVTPEAWRSLKGRNIFAKLVDLTGYRVAALGQPPASVGRGYPLSEVLTPVFDMQAAAGEQVEFQVDIEPLVGLPRTRVSTFLLKLPDAGRLEVGLLDPAAAAEYEDLAALPARSWEAWTDRFREERDPFGPTSFVSVPLVPGTVDRVLDAVEAWPAEELVARIASERARVLGLTMPVASMAPLARRRMIGNGLDGPAAAAVKAVLVKELRRLARALDRAGDPGEILNDIPAYGMDTVVWAALLESGRVTGLTRADRWLRTADFQKKGTYSESVLNQMLSPADDAFRMDYPWFWFEYQSRGRSHNPAWSELLPRRVYYTRQLYGKPQVDLVVRTGDWLVLLDPKTGTSPFDESKWEHWFGLLTGRPELWFEKNPRYRGGRFHTRPILVHTRETYPTEHLHKTLILSFRELNERILARFGDDDRPSRDDWEAFAAELFKVPR